MLYLHQSNQLERLAHHFAALQRIDPLPPFQDEVGKQNSGMGRWLSLQAAKVNGIAANARYLFPAEQEMLRAVLENVPERDRCSAVITLAFIQRICERAGTVDRIKFLFSHRS